MGVEKEGERKIQLIAFPVRKNFLNDEAAPPGSLWMTVRLEWIRKTGQTPQAERRVAGRWKLSFCLWVMKKMKGRRPKGRRPSFQ
jgi:hypothetical protein